MENFVDLYRAHYTEISEETAIAIVRDAGGIYATYAPKELEPRVNVALDALLLDLADPSSHKFGEFWASISYQRARQGYTIGEMERAITAIERVGRDFFHSQISDPDARLTAIERLYEPCQQARVTLFETFVAANTEIIREQASLMQELASPIVPVYQGILVLPLVGRIDDARAGQIMENVLEGIAQYQADVVIMDITGVPVIDTGVANYLVQAAKAARLLGSRAIIVGIGAAIAQTLVQLGVNLAEFDTQANLQAGLEYALRLAGKIITDAPADDERDAQP